MEGEGDAGGEEAEARATRVVASSYRRRIASFSSVADMYDPFAGPGANGGSVGAEPEPEPEPGPGPGPGPPGPAAKAARTGEPKFGPEEDDPCVLATRDEASSYRFRIISFSSAAERYAAGTALPTPPLPDPEAVGAGDKGFDARGSTGESIGGGLLRPCVLATRDEASSYRRRIISFSSPADMYAAGTELAPPPLPEPDAIPDPDPDALGPGAGDDGVDDLGTAGESRGVGLPSLWALATRAEASSNRLRIISFSSAADMYAPFAGFGGPTEPLGPEPEPEPTALVVVEEVAGGIKAGDARGEASSGADPCALDPCSLWVLSTRSRAS